MIEQTRREFLKSTLIGIAFFAAFGAGFSPRVIADEASFDMLAEYGFCLPRVRINDPVALSILQDRMEELLPTGTRYEIRATFPGDFGRGSWLTAYSQPASMSAYDVWESPERIEYMPESGTFLVDRCIVRDAEGVGV